MNFLALGLGEIFLRLVVALVLGVVLGLERVIANKTVGMRTYGLVSMTAAVFVVIALVVFRTAHEHKYCH